LGGMEQGDNIGVLHREDSKVDLKRGPQSTRPYLSSFVRYD
jgi:hypothetical protein